MYMEFNNKIFVDKTSCITKDYNMDSNHLQCIFYKDPYTAEIFEGVFAKDQFMKKSFKKGTYMCVMNEQDSQFPKSHWVMVYQDKKRPIS